MRQADLKLASPNFVALHFRAAASLAGSHYIAADSLRHGLLDCVDEASPILQTFARRIVRDVDDRDTPISNDSDFGLLAITAGGLHHLTLNDEVQVIAACYLFRNRVVKADSFLHIIAQARMVSVTPHTFNYVMQTLAATLLLRPLQSSEDFEVDWTWVHVVRCIYDMAAGWEAHVASDDRAIRTLVTITLKQMPQACLTGMSRQLAAACGLITPTTTTLKPVRASSALVIRGDVKELLCDLIDIFTSPDLDGYLDVTTEGIGRCLLFLCSLHFQRYGSRWTCPIYAPASGLVKRPTR
ncbi:hypothetical protein EXIGLDRAFT_329962 [Exidia glandulosa HHB12029]|uniref:Uncharacterized protein n=1 Tax=Exidia glandulosa HHB12029 TaxID=1314781 RepID=A0A165CSV1_EXIGL|nr:hypothetical protein EXIGLDRAFT_329962 [Exidia glandulosa HHB12029]